MQYYKNLIQDFHRLIIELNTSYIQEFSSSLFLNLEILHNTIKESNTIDNSIAYSLAPLQINLPESLSHTIPIGSNSIIVHFSVKNINLKRNESVITNPIDRLDSFNIVIKGKDIDENELISSWHLDKRKVSDCYNFIEPEFHFTFGGHYMDSNSSWDFGQLLLMRTPRIMHPPLDLILGIDFILNNYISKEYNSIFIGDKRYIEIIQKVKELIWRPYALSFAKKMQNDFSRIDNLKFDKVFINSITG